MTVLHAELLKVFILLTVTAVQGTTLSHFIDFSNSMNLDPNFYTRLCNSSVKIWVYGILAAHGSHSYTYSIQQNVTTVGHVQNSGFL